MVSSIENQFLCTFIGIIDLFWAALIQFISSLPRGANDEKIDTAGWTRPTKESGYWLKLNYFLTTFITIIVDIISGLNLSAVVG
jgi:hypothetical protein